MSNDDRGFLTDGRPYLNARQAAIYCGYEPAPAGTPRLQDGQMHLFFGWLNSRGIRSLPGRRGLYGRADLDAAIAGTPIRATSPDIEAARRLARDDDAEFRRRAHLVARNR